MEAWTSTVAVKTVRNIWIQKTFLAIKPEDLTDGSDIVVVNKEKEGI